MSYKSMIFYNEGLVQDGSNYIANAMELLQNLNLNLNLNLN